LRAEEMGDGDHGGHERRPQIKLDA
jgi:hypothetical protein